MKQLISTIAGQGGEVAVESVVKVLCLKTDSAGTGFLHSSGNIITADHVVKSDSPNDIQIVFPDNRRTLSTEIFRDRYRDLAMLTPSEKVETRALPISQSSELYAGCMVSTWGFPSGYSGTRPLLSVGFLAGSDITRTDPNQGLRECWVINAPFNSGNSGGPVIDVNTESVIGVVSSKLAPIPPIIESALEALGNQKSGFMYEGKGPNGEVVKISEGQVIAEVLHYLRSQTQLVLGQAVLLGDLRQFIKDSGFES